MALVNVNGVDLDVTDIGRGRAVVLIHSWGTSWRLWDPVMARLAPAHRVVAYDWRGCGRSAHPVAGNTIAQNADDLLALCRQLGLDRPVLVGSSVGALFAGEAARVAPDIVGPLVVVGGPGHWGHVMAAALADHRGALATDRAATIERSVASLYGPAVSDAHRRWTAAMLLASGPHIDALFDEQAGYDPRPGLAGLATPIRYIHGRDDAVVPVAVAEELAALSPGNDLCVLAGGHLVHCEQPGAVADAIADWAARPGGTS